jgi:hypothetical protein
MATPVRSERQQGCRVELHVDVICCSNNIQSESSDGTNGTTGDRCHALLPFQVLMVFAITMGSANISLAWPTLLWEEEIYIPTITRSSSL